MRIIAIDASPINGGPASYAVDISASAAEDRSRGHPHPPLRPPRYCCTQCEGMLTPPGAARNGTASSPHRARDPGGRRAGPRRSRQAHDLEARARGAAPPAARGLHGHERGPRLVRPRALRAKASAAAVIAAGSAFSRSPSGHSASHAWRRGELTEAGVALVECGPIPGRFSDPAARRSHARARGSPRPRARGGKRRRHAEAADAQALAGRPSPRSETAR